MPSSKITRAQKKTLPKPNSKNSLAPLNSLDTVVLPPPSSASSGGYGWIHGKESSLTKRDNKRVTMLKTPESIVRSTDDIPAKRIAMPPIGPTKRSRNAEPHSEMARASENYGDPHTDRKGMFRDNSIFNSESNHGWNNYISLGEEFRPDRPSSVPATLTESHDGLTNDPLKFSFRDSWPAHAARMLSPKSPHHSSHTDIFNQETTPTRAERPHSVSSGMSDYDMTMAQRNAAALLIPLDHRVIPPRSLIQGRTVVSQPVEDEKTEIPPPERMPPVIDDGEKPTYSYAMLIGMAILRAPDRKLTLSQIYSWITNTFAFYRSSKPTWHNSIRHNLSLNKAFEKRVRPKDEPGKGSYWAIVDGFEHQFYRNDKKSGLNKPYKFPSVASDINRPNSGLYPEMTSNVADAFAETAELLTRKTSGPSQTKYMLPTDMAYFPIPAAIDNERPGELRRADDRMAKKSRAQGACLDHATLPTSSDMDSWESTFSNDIPSDGTEPDERLINDRERRPNKSSPELEGSFNKRSQLSFSERDFPQMHAMSTTSSQLVNSNQELCASSELPSTLVVNGLEALKAIKKATSGNLDTNDVKSTNNNVARSVNTNYDESKSEKVVPFRCSTPSLIRGSQSNTLLDELVAPKVLVSQVSSSNSRKKVSSSNDKPAPISAAHDELKDNYPQLQAPESPPRNLESPCKSSSKVRFLKGQQRCTTLSNESAKDSVTSGGDLSVAQSDELPSLSHTDVSTSTSDFGHSSFDDPLEILRQQSLPQTPVRELRKTTLVPSTNKRRVQFLRPAMLHYQSLESPYAGTLELSPGVPRLENHHISSNLYQNRQVFCNVADYLDMDFSRLDYGTEKSMRFVYDSPADPASDMSSAAVQHTPASATYNHAYVFPLDVENSPKMVVTPLRRPFDTPIRDVSHTFSPYYKTTNVGSPLRRR